MSNQESSFIPTIEQRHKIYEHARSVYWSKNNEIKGMCRLIANSANALYGANLDYYKVHMADLFPELAAIRPIGKSNNELWWEHSIDRTILFNILIILTYPTLSLDNKVDVLLTKSFCELSGLTLMSTTRHSNKQ